MKIASNKAVPKNTTTAVGWAFRVVLDCVHHSGEVEGRINTVQDHWCHARSEEQKIRIRQFRRTLLQRLSGCSRLCASFKGS